MTSYKIDLGLNVDIQLNVLSREAIIYLQIEHWLFNKF